MASTKGTYQELYPEKLLSALTYIHREYAAPIDDTSVWNTLEDLQAYLNMPGSYAYPGQIVAVANGGVNAGDDTEFSIYLIRGDKSLQPLSSTKYFGSAAEVEENIDKMAAGTIISVWNEALEHHELFTVEFTTEGEEKKTLRRQSFNPEDIPDVSWDNLKNKPESTVADIDAAVDFSKQFTETTVTDPENPEDPGADIISYKNKQLAYLSDIPTTYDAAKVTGVLSVDNIPHGALERCVVVADNAAKDALTIDDAQPGDTVKVESTKQMYFVVGQNEDGALTYTDYTATAATSVPWSGVTNKPNTLSGYGITDAISVTEVSEEAAPGKLLKLDADGKLPTDITGDAATVGGKSPDDFAPATETANNISDLQDRMDAAEDTINSTASNISSLSSQQETNTTAIQSIKNQLPDILNGSSITSFDASKIDGIIDRENLPVDVSGMGIPVANAEERLALTNTTVHNGWIVKQVDTTALYLVIDDTKLSEDAGYMLLIENSSIKVDWDNIENKPTTAEDLGLTDVVMKSDVVTTATANKILQLDSNAKLPADITGSAAKLGDQLPAYYAKSSDVSDLTERVDGHDTDIAGLKDGSLITALAATKLTGTINIENLPHGALERCVVVTTEADRLALTNDNVQAGDTVKVTDTEKMYFVVDDTNLNNESGYEVYTAGTASSVAWSGVTGKPTTLSGYGITDAINSSEVVNKGGTANAGKILRLNAEGKLDADLSGEVSWEKISNKPTSTVEQIDTAVTDSAHTNRTVLDKLKMTQRELELPTGSNMVVTSLGFDSHTLVDLDFFYEYVQLSTGNAVPLGATAPSNAIEGSLWIEPITGVS